MHTTESLVTQALSYEGMLLDYNGTISDDEAMLERCYNEALSQWGKPLAEGEYEEVCGKSEYDLARILLTRRGIDLNVQDEFIGVVAKEYAKATTAEPTIAPATRELLLELIERGYPMAIVTGTLRAMILPVLEAQGLQALIPTLTTAEDVTHGKPHPEGFLRGATLLGIAPERLLVFEDSADGMSAASAAGMDFIRIGSCTPPAGDEDRTSERCFATFAEFATEALEHLRAADAAPGDAPAGSALH